jgi:hypothetical protein
MTHRRRDRKIEKESLLLWQKETVIKKHRVGTRGVMAQRSNDRDFEKIPFCYDTKEQRERLWEGGHGVMTERISDREISEWIPWCYDTRKHR